MGDSRKQFLEGTLGMGLFNNYSVSAVTLFMLLIVVEAAYKDTVHDAELDQERSVCKALIIAIQVSLIFVCVVEFEKGAMDIIFVHPLFPRPLVYQFSAVDFAKGRQAALAEFAMSLCALLFDRCCSEWLRRRRNGC